MTLPEHEYANAERKRREDDIWNAAIEEAADIYRWNECDFFRDDRRKIRAQILSLKRPTS